MNKKNNKNISGKYPKRPVITTRNRNLSQALYQATDAVALLEPGQIAVGTIQHPDTSLWQVWLSTNGLDFTQLAAFRELEKARDAVTILKTEEEKGALVDPRLMAALFQFLEQQSDGDVLPLPEDVVRKLARDIIHKVIRE